MCYVSGFMIAKLLNIKIKPLKRQRTLGLTRTLIHVRQRICTYQIDQTRVSLSATAESDLSLHDRLSDLSLR